MSIAVGLIVGAFLGGLYAAWEGDRYRCVECGGKICHTHRHVHVPR